MKVECEVLWRWIERISIFSSCFEKSERNLVLVGFFARRALFSTIVSMKYLILFSVVQDGLAVTEVKELATL